MDRTLADLFTAWWLSGDKDAGRVLADRLRKLPSSDDVAGVLEEFRYAARAAFVTEVFGHTTEAFQSFARALRATPAPDKDANSPP
jgi:hypothetical protein